MNPWGWKKQKTPNNSTCQHWNSIWDIDTSSWIQGNFLTCHIIFCKAKTKLSKGFEVVLFFAPVAWKICISLWHGDNQNQKQHTEQMDSDHLPPFFKQHMVEGSYWFFSFCRQLHWLISITWARKIAISLTYWIIRIKPLILKASHQDERESNCADNPPHSPEDQVFRSYIVVLALSLCYFGRDYQAEPSLVQTLLHCWYTLVRGSRSTGLVRRERDIGLTGRVCGQSAVEMLQKEASAPDRNVSVKSFLPCTTSVLGSAPEKPPLKVSTVHAAITPNHHHVILHYTFMWNLFKNETLRVCRRNFLMYRWDLYPRLIALGEAKEK